MSGWGEALAKAVIAHQHEQMGHYHRAAEPVFNVGDLVTYHGSIVELRGHQATIERCVEQPLGKAYRTRYELWFANGQRAGHVRPTSFTLVG